jgi:hypothetical protein
MKQLISTISTVIFFTILFSCQGKNSEGEGKVYEGIDYVFASHYQNCLSIISLHHLGSESIDAENVLNALTCLKAITGIDHHIYLGDMIGYRSEEDFVKDIKAWSEWFAENKYGYTFKDAMEAFENYRQKEEVQPEWPLFYTDIIGNLKE